MIKILLTLLFIPSLSWGSIKLVCQGHSMVQVQYPDSGSPSMINAKYFEKPTVTINENENMILVRGVVDGIMAYRIETWRSDEDAFFGIARHKDDIKGQIHIDRISGAMIRMTYSPNKKNKKTLLEFYYDCDKASKKF